MGTTISIVIPLLNEEASVVELHRRLSAVTQQRPEIFEFIFVDDGSEDETLLKLKGLRAFDARVRILCLSRRFGHQVALSAGLDHAEGDAVITMDGDLQHPPEVLTQFLQSWTEGFPVVYGVREESSPASLFKRIPSNLFYFFFQKLSGLRLPQNAPDFRLMDRRVVETLRTMKERHRFLRGLTHWMGYPAQSILFVSPPRPWGASRYTFGRMCRLGLDGLTSFSAAPLYLAAYSGALLAVGGAFYSIYVLYSRFITHNVLPGWTSLILTSSLLGGLQFFFLGILGLYIGRIFEEVKSRPLYVVGETYGLNKPSEHARP
jgi:glycosyltransferase involved in cell wall biosynthesis